MTSISESRPQCNSEVRIQPFDPLPRHIEDALRASIKRVGVLMPVVKDQHDNLLDGHHRARIADELKVPYRVDVISVSDEDEAHEIARTLNADRRQLTEGQRRAVVALRQEGHSERAIAGAMGVSQPTVHAHLRRATDRGLSVQPDRVVGLDGKSRPARRPTIVAAKNNREAERAQQALARMGDAPDGKVYDLKRAERVAREQESARRRAEAIVPVTTSADAIEIRHGDFQLALADLEPGSVDAIITDPPYVAEWVQHFGDLGAFAARVLKPTGVFAALVGQCFVREYLRALDDHLAYRWMGAWLTPGNGPSIYTARVTSDWKPILIYARQDAGDLRWIVRDVIATGTDDKRFHHWGQSATGTGNLVERLTQPGDLVVDPCLGGGTTAVVCRQLGRRFIGCDCDGAAVSTARERVA